MIASGIGRHSLAIYAILVAQAVASLSLSQVRTMPPSAAGNAILGDQPHGQIESFQSPTGGMLPPDAIEGQLVERPNLLASSCVRKVWTVLFRAAPGADISTAKAESRRDSQEIALPIHHSCPSGRYAYLNPGISIDQGRAMLAKLEDVIARSSHAHFLCSDKMPSGLCASDKAIRSALRSLKPWLVTGNGNQVLLGAPGGVVTEVSFGLSEITVKRFIPAPF